MQSSVENNLAEAKRRWTKEKWPSLSQWCSSIFQTFNVGPRQNWHQGFHPAALGLFALRLVLPLMERKMMEPLAIRFCYQSKRQDKCRSLPTPCRWRIPFAKWWSHLQWDFVTKAHGRTSVEACPLLVVEGFLWLHCYLCKWTSMFCGQWTNAFWRVYGFESYSRTSGESNHHRQSVSDTRVPRYQLYHEDDSSAELKLTTFCVLEAENRRHERHEPRNTSS